MQSPAASRYPHSVLESSPPVTSPLGSRALILTAAVLFSTGGAAIKACTMTAWQVASLRSGVAAVAVLLMLPAARRRWNGPTLAVGAFYAATLVLYVAANKMTTAANTIFLQSTAPLYILLLAPALLGERARRRDLLFMFAMVGGMLLVFAGAPRASATAPVPLQGNLAALASGACWALTLIGLRWLGRAGQGAGAAQAVAAGNLIACFAVLPLALPLGPTRPVDWATLAYLGVVQVALAYVALTRGMRRVPALEASLLLLLEPVLNPVWAFLAHGERPGSWALIGGAVILSATTAKAWLDSRRA
jgi:drug/metabolite transporter (DMT)-like permease